MTTLLERHGLFVGSVLDVDLDLLEEEFFQISKGIQKKENSCKLDLHYKIEIKSFRGDL